MFYRNWRIPGCVAHAARENGKSEEHYGVASPTAQQAVAGIQSGIFAAQVLDQHSPASV